MTPLLEIPIREDFRAADGALATYHAYNQGQNIAVQGQRHVNIRSFYPTAITRPLNMFDLAAKTMTALNAMTMTDLAASSKVLVRGEQWVDSTTAAAATVGPDTAAANWYTLRLSLAVGQTVVESSGKVPSGGTATAPMVVNIRDGFTDLDELSVACPVLDPSKLDTAVSAIEFTSNAAGDFSAGPYVSLALNTNLNALPSGVAPKELRWKRSALNSPNLDLSRITGVRLRFQATAITNVTVAAIRLLTQGWLYAPVDTETTRGLLVKGIPRTGDPAAPIAFPAGGVGETWPVLYFAHSPTSAADPRPVDVHTIARFATGAATANSSLTLHFRELPLDYMTQLDLDPDGKGGVTTMAQLDAAGVQPDFGQAKYGNRVQSQLKGLPQSALDGSAQGMLERVPDLIASAYIYVQLVWSSTTASVQISDSEGHSYRFSPSLAANSYYAVIVELEDEGIRVKIHPTDDRGTVDFSTVTFDSTTITDPSFVKRRRGRVGWHANFSDGNAFVDYIRTRYTNFGEYRSHPFTSMTPVSGAQLFVSATPDRQLIPPNSIGAGPYGGTVTTEVVQTRSGKGLRIDTGKALEGIQTGPMYIDSFANTVISFDLLYPTGGAAARPLEVYLLGEFEVIVPLSHTIVAADRWQTVIIEPPTTAVSGEYRLVVVQTPATPLTWYVDNVAVRQRAIKWSARAAPQDPWVDRPVAWTEFKDAINAASAAIMFDERGTALQLSGKAMKQNVAIYKVDLVPKYAELGRFSWV